MKAIETRYAGCRFRSRLEARWAVFFDALDMKWEYEAQGFEVHDRLCGGSNPWNYLPDFWLPEYGLYAEVKGSFPDDASYFKFLSAAAYLSNGEMGGCSSGNDETHDVLILGPIPLADRRSSIPYVLHMHKGDLRAFSFMYWFYYTDHPDYLGRYDPAVAANDCGEIFMPATELLEGHPDKVGDVIANAYRAARSARFEFGEKGGY